MILHTINKSSPNNKLLALCLDSLQEGDCVVLLGDGVNIAKRENNLLADLRPALGFDVKFYALKEHMENVKNKDAFYSKLRVIEYGVFLDLAIQSSASQSWY